MPHLTVVSSAKDKESKFVGPGSVCTCTPPVYNKAVSAFILNLYQQDDSDKTIIAQVSFMDADGHTKTEMLKLTDCTGRYTHAGAAV